MILQEPTEVGPEGSLAQIAYQTLRDEMIAGRLAPNERLRIHKLRETYGIGASPLREALSRLVSDGLVVSLDRRGFMVAPMSLADLRHLTDMRKLLELEALKQSLRYGDDAWESRVVATFHQLSKAQQRLKSKQANDIVDWEKRNEEFHEALVSACPSPWVLRFRSAVYSYTERYRRVCLSITAATRNVEEEHRRIHDAALARDFKAVSTLIGDHLEASYRKVLESGKLTPASI